MKKNKKRVEIKKPKQEKRKKKTSLFLLSLNNLSAGIAFAILLYVVFTNYSGYQWIMNKLIHDNIQFISEHPELSLKQKLESKLGFEYTFMDYIKQNSAEDAIILFPFEAKHYADPAFTLNNYTNPKLTIMRREHVASFLYPRTVVFLKDKTTDPNYFRSTHIAIVDFHGYELLPQYKNRDVQHGLLTIVSNSRR